MISAVEITRPGEPCAATGDAVLAASIFHFGEHTVAEAKLAMLEAGVTVRPPGA